MSQYYTDLADREEVPESHAVEPRRRTRAPHLHVPNGTEMTGRSCLKPFGKKRDEKENLWFQTAVEAIPYP